MLHSYSSVRAFLILGLLCMGILWIEACRCPPEETRQEKCRRADFSFIGYGHYAGTTKLYDFYYIRYCFLIERVFKDRYSSLQNPCVITPVQYSMCGLRFQPGQRYIVNGQYDSGVNQVDACQWNEIWSSVPFAIRIQLSNNPLLCLP